MMLKLNQPHNLTSTNTKKPACYILQSSKFVVKRAITSPGSDL